MATYTTSQSTAAGKVYASGVAREKISLAAIVAVTTAMIDNTNDSVGLFYAPKGFVVTGIRVGATDMDTNVTPTLAFDIGDSGSQNRLMAASAVGQAGTWSSAMARTGFLYKYTAKTLISAYVQAVSATGAAGTLYVEVEGFVDEDYDTTALVAA